MKVHFDEGPLHPLFIHILCKLCFGYDEIERNILRDVKLSLTYPNKIRHFRQTFRNRLFKRDILILAFQNDHSEPGILHWAFDIVHFILIIPNQTFILTIQIDFFEIGFLS
jgi:hypothetical protein